MMYENYVRLILTRGLKYLKVNVLFIKNIKDKMFSVPDI